MRLAYLDGGEDGPRSFESTAWAVRGCVEPLTSARGHSRPGRAGRKSGYVRYGPTATKLFSAAACRDGPTPDLTFFNSNRLNADRH